MLKAIKKTIKNPGKAVKGATRFSLGDVWDSVTDVADDVWDATMIGSATNAAVGAIGEVVENPEVLVSLPATATTATIGGLQELPVVGNVVEDVVEGGEHVLNEIGDTVDDITGAVGDVFGGGDDPAGAIAEAMKEQLALQREIYEFMKKKLPEAEAEARRTYERGLTALNISQARGAQMAGRMGALGYSSGAMAGALGSMMESAGQQALNLGNVYSQALVNIPPAYIKGATAGFGYASQYANAMAAMQQPSFFDRLIQLGTLAALF